MINKQWGQRCFVVMALFTGLLTAGCEQRGQDARMGEFGTLNAAKDFTLKDQDGKVFHLKDHRDQLVLLFFGYLSCPDICPMTLSKVTKAMNLLGKPWKGKILTVFVSIDTNRDTSAKLKEYLSYFNIESVGLTGTKEEVDAVVNAYKASYQRVETDSVMGYLFDHSDYLYLIDHQGTVRYLFRMEDKAEHVAETIKRLSNSAR